LKKLRVAFLAAAVLLLMLMPVGDAAVLLLLFVAADLAAAALFLSSVAATPRPAMVVSIGDEQALPLLRRTVPELRSRRPAGIIEAQVAWRQAAAFRRRHGVVARRSPSASQSPW
jgi:hypothetical protein